jgi:hypothetical protein
VRDLRESRVLHWRLVATSQDEFGGAWTQQKLVALGKYLQAYTNIFKRNRRAQYYSISYVDAFAGTGSLQRPEPGALAEFLPELLRNEEQYRKGSVLRALDIEPPFDNYIFIEKVQRSVTNSGELQNKFDREAFGSSMRMQTAESLGGARSWTPNVSEQWFFSIPSERRSNGKR